MTTRYKKHFKYYFRYSLWRWHHPTEWYLSIYLWHGPRKYQRHIFFLIFKKNQTMLFLIACNLCWGMWKYQANMEETKLIKFAVKVQLNSFVARSRTNSIKSAKMLSRIERDSAVSRHVFFEKFSSMELNSGSKFIHLYRVYRVFG